MKCLASSSSVASSKNSKEEESDELLEGVEQEVEEQNEQNTGQDQVKLGETNLDWSFFARKKPKTSETNSVQQANVKDNNNSSDNTTNKQQEEKDWEQFQQKILDMPDEDSVVKESNILPNQSGEISDEASTLIDTLLKPKQEAQITKLHSYFGNQNYQFLTSQQPKPEFKKPLMPASKRLHKTKKQTSQNSEPEDEELDALFNQSKKTSTKKTSEKNFKF